jgi:large subunit ribosomal protein L19
MIVALQLPPKERIFEMSSTVIRALEQEQMRKDIPDFGPGDTVRAWLKVVEGGKERLQAFEGVCLVRARRNSLKETVTLRKISHSIGVERTIMIHSPRLDSVEVVRLGVVRRARLFFLRDKIGKQARLKERRTPRVDKNAGK